jgi:biopolymer transport protein TolR
MMMVGSDDGDKAGRHRRWRGAAPLMSEINVTPFVDVMLVLLIIFMITAPLLTVGVPVDLPESRAPAITDQIEPLVVTVDASGTIYVQETPVEFAQLTPLLQATVSADRGRRIYVRGSQRLEYGAVMRVMGEITGAGFRRVALITDPEL